MRVANELWAIVDNSNRIVWSRGGSSSRPHLMVYETEKSAKAGLRNAWTRQILSEDEVRIIRMY